MGDGLIYKKKGLYKEVRAGGHRGGDGDEARGAQEQRRPQALRYDPEVQDRGAAVALQSVRRADRVPDPRPPLVHALSRSGLEDPVPDATTIWLFREALVEAGLIDKLFERFGQHLEAKGYIARGGQIIDATIVSAPKQRNTKDENEAIKAGKTPEEWEKKPAKNAQKDKDARWTKKHGQSFYGYKNHIGVDKAHKLIRKWDATDAARARQPEARRCARSRQHRQGGVGRQRLPLGRDRGAPEGEGLEEPHPPARRTQSSAVRAPGSRRTRRARRCAPVSSTYSATSRTRWAARSCAPSASRGRGSRSG